MKCDSGIRQWLMAQQRFAEIIYCRSKNRRDRARNEIVHHGPRTRSSKK